MKATIVQINPRIEEIRNGEHNLKIKEIDGWIDEACIKLIADIKRNAQAYRGLFSKLDEITAFESQKKRLLEGRS